MTWQPIETAPRDGTVIDLWMVTEERKGFRIPDAYWVTNQPYSARMVWKKRDGWMAANQEYDGADGWADVPKFTTVEGKEVWTLATHWMPLPEPPQTKP